MVMDESKSPVSNNKVGKTSQALSPVKLHKVKGSYGQVESGGEGEGEVPLGGEGVWSISRQEESPSTAAGVVASPSYKELRMSQSHSKKVIKHALRQQAKRRRKNTTIAAGNSAPLPRILMPPQCELEEASNRTSYRPPTMLEVLSSIPGFSIKQRKRSNKKLSAAAQLEQTKEGCIDLETPDSILVNTNLRSLLNKHTFNTLPALYQYKLVQLLPHVDRTTPAGDSFRLSASGLNNEFFARACLEWKERLAEGEFTPENQQKLKAEAEREKSKLDPWKLKHFEPIWGESASGVGSVRVEWTPPPAALPPKPTKPPVKVKTPPTPPPPRLRTVGAITRAVASYREKREAEENNLTESNKRVKSSNKSESPKTETAESTNIPQLEAESRANKAELRPAEEEISRTSKAELRPAEEEMRRTSEAELRPAEEEMSRTNKAELRPAEDEMKENEIKVKDNWVELASEVTVESKSDSVEEMDGKCAELSVGEWGSVEVVSMDPAQENEENSDTEKHMEDELSDCDKSRLVCDISTSNDTVAKEETVVREEVKEEAMEEGVGEKEEDLKEEDTQDGNDSQEESHSACLFSQETVANEEVTESEMLTSNETGALEVNDAHNEHVCDIIEPLENDLKLSESLHNDLCQVIEGNQDKTSFIPSDSCDKSVGDITEYNDGQEVSECITDLDSLSHQEQSSLHQNDNEMPASQESTSTYDCNSAVTEEEKFNTHFSEGQSNEETSEEKFTEELSENLNEERYDVDMANINDSLELVNEETSLQPSIETHNKEELSNHQEFVDSQSDLKDDGGGYSVKMEEELDLQDATSNIQSQDSQDTRPDEELSCPQDNSPEFIIPDSEIVVSGVDEADCGGSARGDGNYNIYSSVLYQEALKEEEEVEAAAIFAAAWGAVDSSTEKLLAQVALQEEEGEVNVIPMQEELEVRLEEIKSGSEWPSYEKLSAPSASLGQLDKPHSPPQYQGHVKLELEVTLTPEVDSQVSSTMEGSSTAGGSGLGSSGSAMCDDTSVNVSSALTVIPPTTIVCLPSATPQLPPHTTAAPGVVSSSAVPYLALSTSTPVRALPTKPKPSVGVQSGGRTSRNVSSKPPPGAVNLERSYQICQAVIQNSPNRDQLRCQLKPPPSLLIGKSDKTQYSVVTSSRAGKVVGPSKPRTFQQRPTAPVLVKHVFTSSQGIPVTMAVLPHTQPTTNPEVAESQMGHYVLVQRTGAQVRRSSSAPPSNNENLMGLEECVSHQCEAWALYREHDWFTEEVQYYVS